MILLAIKVWLNKLRLNHEFRVWQRNHTVKDLEYRLIELGCTKVNTRNSIIFTTPNKVGKIVIDDKYVWINPKDGKR